MLSEVAPTRPGQGDFRASLALRALGRRARFPPVIPPRAGAASGDFRTNLPLFARVADNWP